MRYLSLFALIILSTPMLSYADTLFVHARQAKIHAEPKMSAEVITTLAKSSAVKVLEKQGRWIKISSGEYRGWVSKLLVKKTPPLDNISIIEDSTQNINDNARRRASSNASSAATRGLRGEERARSSDSDSINFSAVERMEKMLVSEPQLQSFKESELAD